MRRSAGVGGYLRQQQIDGEKQNTKLYLNESFSPFFFPHPQQQQIHVFPSPPHQESEGRQAPASSPKPHTNCVLPEWAKTTQQAHLGIKGQFYRENGGSAHTGRAAGNTDPGGVTADLVHKLLRQKHQSEKKSQLLQKIASKLRQLLEHIINRFEPDLGTKTFPFSL